MFKSFDLIGEGQGLFTISVILIAFGLMIAFYISSENSKKTNVVQTPVVKTQVQVLTVEDEILALEQIGLGFVTNKLNKSIDGLKIETKITKGGWGVTVKDIDNGRYAVKVNKTRDDYIAKVVDKVNKINFNMEKVK
jgi:membrane protein implicated in regulation of membrane protease activity